MSSTAWVIALGTVGLVAEVAGLVLIVLDIRDSRRQARQIVERGQRHRIEQVVEDEQPPPMAAIGGQQPSLDERIALLEGRHQELVDGLGAVRREFRADATERARHIEEIIRGDYAVLKDVLSDMLAGSLGRRILGGIELAGGGRRRAGWVVGGELGQMFQRCKGRRRYVGGGAVAVEVADGRWNPAPVRP